MNDLGRAFTQQIIAGDWDDQLDAISDAIHSRYKVKQVEAAAALAVGDAVTFSDEARPPWAGLTGVVTAKTRGGKIRVTIDKQPSIPDGGLRLRNSRKTIIAGAMWTVPAEWLNRINNKEA